MKFNEEVTSAMHLVRTKHDAATLADQFALLRDKNCVERQTRSSTMNPTDRLVCSTWVPFSLQELL